MAGVPELEKNGTVLQLVFKVIEKAFEENTELTFSRLLVNDLKVTNCTNGYVYFAKSETEVPNTFQLAQNYPNPFIAKTIIGYGILDTKNKQVYMTLNIYNINGQLMVKR